MYNRKLSTELFELGGHIELAPPTDFRCTWLGAAMSSKFKPNPSQAMYNGKPSTEIQQGTTHLFGKGTRNHVQQKNVDRTVRAVVHIETFFRQSSVVHGVALRCIRSVPPTVFSCTWRGAPLKSKYRFECLMGYIAWRRGRVLNNCRQTHEQKREQQQQYEQQQHQRHAATKHICSHLQV
jgi:hypothetical protein